VSQLTGVSSHVIRAWERRYRAITPARTEGNQRRYSESDLNRLRLLSRAVAAGYAIGKVAGLSDRELSELTVSRPAGESSTAGVEQLLNSALDSVRRLDSTGLEKAVVGASVALGITGAIEQVIVPMMDEIGRAWHAGTLRIMHEHMATAVVRSFLGSALRAQESDPTAAGVVVAAPAGQSHELGALACAVTAASAGFRVTYLGPNVPPEEILAAVKQTNSVAVVLSVVFPSSLVHTQEQLAVLRRQLPEGARLIVGGVSAAQVGAEAVVRTLGDLRRELSELTAADAAVSSRRP
jgi:methanogenic corrinoid protein MtbC1